MSDSIGAGSVGLVGMAGGDIVGAADPEMFDKPGTGLGDKVADQVDDYEVVFFVIAAIEAAESACSYLLQSRTYMPLESWLES